MVEMCVAVYVCDMYVVIRYPYCSMPLDKYGRRIYM